MQVAGTVWRELNQNSGAIQAFASLLVAAVTVVLVWTTSRYVKLTSRLAAAAETQIRFQEEAERARLRKLRSYLDLFQLLLGDLPTQGQQADQIRQATTWNNKDLHEAQRLASTLGEGPGKHAAVAVGAMRYLREKIEEIKATDPAMVDWSLFPWDAWAKKLEQAKRQLAELSAALEPSQQPDEL